MIIIVNIFLHKYGANNLVCHIPEYDPAELPAREVVVDLGLDLGYS